MMQSGIRTKLTGLSLALCALALSSCQLSSPATRIQQDPALFSALPEMEQSLVQQGQIREGMSEQAVFLAWGKPDTPPFTGQRDGKRLVRWVYTAPEPVFIDRPAWGWRGCPYDDAFCFGGTDIAYMRRMVAYVVFEDGKVSSWGARQQP